MTTVKKETFSSYMFQSFDRIIDLTPMDQEKLQYLLNRVFGSYYDVQSFMDEFGFQKRDFLEFYQFIKEPVTRDLAQAFGLKCYHGVENSIQTSKVIH